MRQIHFKKMIFFVILSFFVIISGCKQKVVDPENPGGGTGTDGKATYAATYDDGATWGYFTTTIVDDFYGYATFDPTPYNGYTGIGTVNNVGKIVRTSNGGNTWDVIASPVSEIYNCVKGAGTNVGIICGANGTILRTGDDGFTWSKIVSGTTANLQSIAFDTSSALIGLGYIAGNNAILRTIDGGVSWSNLATAPPVNFNCIYLKSSAVVFAVGNSNNAYYSTNNGDTWETYPVSATSNDLRSISFASDSLAIIVGAGGKIFKSADFGATWTEKPSGTTALIRSIIATPTVCIAAGDNVILVSGDLGETWFKVDKTSSFREVFKIDDGVFFVLGN